MYIVKYEYMGFFFLTVHVYIYYENKCINTLHLYWTLETPPAFSQELDIYSKSYFKKIFCCI